MSTTRGVNKSLHWVFKDRQPRTRQLKERVAFPMDSPFRRAIRFQGQCHYNVPLWKRKENSSWGGCQWSQFRLCCHSLSTSWFRNVNRIPFRYPFLFVAKKKYFQKEFSYLLGSTHPCSIAVHMEPFSTSVFKVLIWIVATATKICTRTRFIPAHATKCITCSTPPYSTQLRICCVGQV